MSRTKSFWNEIKEGALFAIKQPRNFCEIWWTAELYAARLYLYYKAFKELKRKKSYVDGWRGEANTETKFHFFQIKWIILFINSMILMKSLICKTQESF